MVTLKNGLKKARIFKKEGEDFEKMFFAINANSLIYQGMKKRVGVVKDQNNLILFIGFNKEKKSINIRTPRGEDRTSMSIFRNNDKFLKIEGEVTVDTIFDITMSNIPEKIKETVDSEKLKEAIEIAFFLDNLKID